MLLIYDLDKKIYYLEPADAILDLAAYLRPTLRFPDMKYKSETVFILGGYRKAEPEEVLPQSEIDQAIKDRSENVDMRLRGSPSGCVIANDPSPWRAPAPRPAPPEMGFARVEFDGLPIVVDPPNGIEI